MDITDEKTRHRIEMTKMFDVSEEPIMKYISYYLNKPMESIFKTVPDFAKYPHNTLSLAPLTSYPNKILNFHLEIVPCDYKLLLPKEIQNDSYVQDVFRFFDSAINEIFAKLIERDIKEDVMPIMFNSSLNFEFEAYSGTFRPIFINPTRRKHAILTKISDDLLNYKKQIDWNALQPSERDQWNHNFGQVLVMLSNIHLDAQVIKAEEDRVNNNLRTSKRLGIVFSEFDT